MSRISQREARRLRKRVQELEDRERQRLSAWGGGYPGGVHLASRQIETGEWFFGALKTARRLGCALVATISDSGQINYYAVKL